VRDRWSRLDGGSRLTAADARHPVDRPIERDDLTDPGRLGVRHEIRLGEVEPIRARPGWARPNREYPRRRRRWQHRSSTRTADAAASFAGRMRPSTRISERQGARVSDDSFVPGARIWATAEARTRRLRGVPACQSDRAAGGPECPNAWKGADPPSPRTANRQRRRVVGGQRLQPRKLRRCRSNLERIVITRRLAALVIGISTRAVLSEAPVRPSRDSRARRAPRPRLTSTPPRW
jgi:hypothetical protein